MITKPLFEELIQEIEQAGTAAHDYFTSDDTQNEQKADGSVVTAVDQAIEQVLVQYIRRVFPDDSIVGEEGDGYVGSSSFVWHIDPIDGTDNFLRKIPFCAISVARLGDTVEDSFGIVHNPITGQTFAALMDEGVYENTRIHNINESLLGGKALLSIGNGKESWMKSASYNLRKAFGMQFGGGYSYRWCALEMAYVAANRFDGMLVFGLNSYDYAAGLFLIKAGGGSISVFRDGVWQAWTAPLKELCQEHGETIFASHAGVHDAVLECIGDPRQWSDE